jgi:hypothetical protein
MKKIHAISQSMAVEPETPKGKQMLNQRSSLRAFGTQVTPSLRIETRRLTKPSTPGQRLKQTCENLLFRRRTKVAACRRQLKTIFLTHRTRDIRRMRLAPLPLLPNHRHCLRDHRTSPLPHHRCGTRHWATVRIRFLMAPLSHHGTRHWDLVHIVQRGSFRF